MGNSAAFHGFGALIGGIAVPAIAPKFPGIDIAYTLLLLWHITVPLPCCCRVFWEFANFAFRCCQVLWYSQYNRVALWGQARNQGLCRCWWWCDIYWMQLVIGVYNQRYLIKMSSYPVLECCCRWQFNAILTLSDGWVTPTKAEHGLFST